MAKARSSPAFTTAYKKLNSEQKKAVDTIEGPVMVIAGPGTGKTQILTLRIANILKQTDTPPDAILALTFTESAARSMRARLVDIIGTEGYRVHIHTFHGFCNEIINRFPEAFPRIIGAAHITDADKVRILRKIITDGDFSVLRPFGDPYHHIAAIRQKISALKRENISPERLKELIAQSRAAFEGDESRFHTKGAHKGKLKGAAVDEEKRIAKNEELAEVYAAYEQALTGERQYDYDDMIVETIHALERDENLLRSLQEEYLYILADEHQDANAGQNRLLTLLASFYEQPNLFVVGDEKQAIYRFQGASLENFLSFQEQYPDAEIITLARNYRSCQSILDGAHTLITARSGETDSRKPLTGTRESGPAVSIAALSSPEYEYRFLAEDIRKRIDEEGIEPSEIAVLYRTNRDADEVVRVFEQVGIPFVVESEQNVLLDVDIKKFFTLLSGIAKFGNDEALAALLHIDFLEMAPLNAYRAVRYAARHRLALYDVIRSSKHLHDAGCQEAGALRELHGRLEQWKKHSGGEALGTFFERLAHESGFIAHLLKSPYAIEKLEKLHSVFNDLQALLEAHGDYGLADYLAYLALLEESGIAITARMRGASGGAVRLMTAHRAKGLEFDCVYIIRAVFGHWGNRRAREQFHIPLETVSGQPDANDDDERRLFYVALTRARERAIITYACENRHGREQLPAQFLEELPEHCIERVATAAFEHSLRGVPLVAMRTPQKPGAKDVAYLQELFLEQGLSVTALNNYLRCPWQYFYRNLLRIPEARTKSLCYGTAVHNALKDFFEKVRKSERPKSKELVALFETHLERQPLAPFEHKESLERGKKALVGFAKARVDIWREQQIKNEWRIDTLLPLEVSEIGKLRLRGDLDKAIFENEGALVVVDYKTGQPKSRNHILGKTKAPDSGDYYRQLVFYRLLIESFDGGKYRMRAGEIDFVEPDKKSGTYKVEQFTIPDEDVAALTETVQGTAEAIYNLHFWDTRCDDKHCRYCALRDLMA